MTNRWAARIATAGLAGFLAVVPAAAAQAATGTKTVYFTFDDGPGAGTAELLDATAAYDAKVSLFYIGRHAERTPGLVARAAAEGHVIGNHTYSHESLTTLNDDQVRQQLVRGRDALRPYVSNCWRPPRWLTSPAIEQTAKSLGMRQTLSLMTPTETRRVFVPAAQTDVDAIVATVRDNVYDGAMVTLHAEGAATSPQLRAFKRLLPLLTARGYRFAALPHCDRPTHRLLAVGDGDGAYRGSLDAYLRRDAEPYGLNYRWVGGIPNSPATGLNHDGRPDWTVGRLSREIGDLQAAHLPDVILINAGALDLARGAAPATVGERFGALLARIRRNQPTVRVLVSIPPCDAALRIRLRHVVNEAGDGFRSVDLSGATGARGVARRYYEAMRATMPGGRAWRPVAQG